MISEVLLSSLHSKLRWRGGLWGQGTLGALLLGNGELALLRLLLSSMAALNDDEASLTFMRELFQVQNDF